MNTHTNTKHKRPLILTVRLLMLKQNYQLKELY